MVKTFKPDLKEAGAFGQNEEPSTALRGFFREAAEAPLADNAGEPRRFSRCPSILPPYSLRRHSFSFRVWPQVAGCLTQYRPSSGEQDAVCAPSISRRRCWLFTKSRF